MHFICGQLLSESASRLSPVATSRPVCFVQDVPSHCHYHCFAPNPPSVRHFSPSPLSGHHFSAGIPMTLSPADPMTRNFADPILPSPSAAEVLDQSAVLILRVSVTPDMTAKVACVSSALPERYWSGSLVLRCRHWLEHPSRCLVVVVGTLVARHYRMSKVLPTRAAGKQV
jgi:hypothetical protein